MPDPVLPTAVVQQSGTEPASIGMMAQPTAFHSVHPPVAIHGPLLVNPGEWADELADCNTNAGVCWATICCQGIVVAQLAQKVIKVPCLVTTIFMIGLTVLYLLDHQGLMGNPFGKVCIVEPCGTTLYGEPTGFQMSWLSIILSATSCIFLFSMICYIRVKLRNKDRIPGSIFEDICLSLPCISCCTTCQMMRHVISRSIRRSPDGPLTYAKYKLCSQDGTGSFGYDPMTDGMTRSIDRV